MPWKRSLASNDCSWSRIFVSGSVEIEEVARDPPQDECLQAGEVEQAELQRLLDGSQEGLRGICALHLDQTAERAQAAATGVLLKRRGIACEDGMITAEQLLLECDGAVCPHRGGMVLRQGASKSMHLRGDDGVVAGTG